MLTAVCSGKAGRVRIENGVLDFSWRDVFRRSEDLLTAVFFGRFQYLSDETLVRVLDLLLGDGVAKSLGSLQEVDFWPHLKGVKERSWVEPDVVLRFANADVIAEVKPPFGGEQKIAQWLLEIRAYVTECQSGSRTQPKTLHFLALGHNRHDVSHDFSDTYDTGARFNLVLHTCEWEPLVVSLNNLASDCERADAAVLADWHRAFELFGLKVHLPVNLLDLFSLIAKQPLSLDALGAWRGANLRDGDSAYSKNSAIKTRTSTSLQALVEFGRAHPLELQTWK